MARASSSGPAAGYKAKVVKTVIQLQEMLRTAVNPHAMDIHPTAEVKVDCSDSGKVALRSSQQT